MNKMENQHTDMPEQAVVVPEQLNGGRLDKVVKVLFDIPWKMARNRIERGQVQVNDQIKVELDRVVNTGDCLKHLPNAPAPKTRDAFDPSCIIYQDSHLLVANKPADILTVPFEKWDMHTFDRQLRTHLARTEPARKKRRGALPPLMVVHRLDKLTSGILVFPRTFEAKKSLSEQFRAHTIERRYVALVHGHPQSKTIRSHIVADRGDGIRGSVETSPHKKVRNSRQGQVAITHLTVIEQFAQAALVECQLETGRTNQIRIHMMEEHAPLIGERTYMRGYKGPRIDSLRLMLHARTLSFDHPVTGERVRFEAPFPLHFKKMEQRLRQQNAPIKKEPHSGRAGRQRPHK